MDKIARLNWKRIARSMAWMMLGVAGTQLDSEWGTLIFAACVLMLFFDD